MGSGPLGVMWGGVWGGEGAGSCLLQAARPVGRRQGVGAAASRCRCEPAGAAGIGAQVLWRWGAGASRPGPSAATCSQGSAWLRATRPPQRLHLRVFS